MFTNAPALAPTHAPAQVPIDIINGDDELNSDLVSDLDINCLLDDVSEIHSVVQMDIGMSNNSTTIDANTAEDVVSGTKRARVALYQQYITVRADYIDRKCVDWCWR